MPHHVGGYFTDSTDGQSYRVLDPGPRTGKRFAGNGHDCAASFGAVGFFDMQQQYGGILALVGLVVVMVLFRVVWFLNRERDRAARR